MTLGEVAGASGVRVWHRMGAGCASAGMPHVSSDGVRIHYDVRGEGPPLVLMHGYTSRRAVWDVLGYASALARHCRLILIDGRGHGESDKPRDADAYALHRRAGDITAVLDHLGIGAAHVLGYSMGGWIGLGLAVHAPQRLRSLIVGGADACADAAWGVFRSLDPADPDPTEFVMCFESVLGERFSDEQRAMILDNDLAALAAAGRERDSLEAALPTIRVPCLFYAGEADRRLARIRDTAERVPDAALVVLPGLRHIDAYMQADAVLPHVVRFLDAAQ